MELALETSEAHVFLWPGSTPDAEGVRDSAPKDDAVLVAFVALSIPPGTTPPSKIQALTLNFEATENIGFPSGFYETNTPFSVKINCEQAANMPLSSGKVYRWEFPIRVPHDSPPYERCNSGRVYYRLSAKVTFAGGLLKKRPLVAEKDMFLITVPTQDGVLDYARSHGSFAEHLGPIAIVVRSQHLTVGGYARLALSLPSPSPTLQIESVAMSLVQHTVVKSRKGTPAAAEAARPERLNFFTIDAAEMLSKKTSDGAYDGSWIARLPKDDVTRPSTLPNSKAAIRISHTLEVRIVFRPDASAPDAKPLVYSASWSVVLPHCCCLWRSLRLPTYSISDPDPVPERGRDDWQPEKYANIHVSQSGCACGETLQTLLEWEDEADDDQALCTTRAIREDMHAQWIREGPGSVRAAAATHLQMRSRAANGRRAPGADDEEAQPDAAAAEDEAAALESALRLPEQLNETPEERRERERRAKETQQYVSVEDYQQP